jgi:hypothetical protein
VSNPEVDKVKQMAEKRMREFDLLPKSLQDIANKHGLAEALRLHSGRDNQKTS